MSEPLAIPLSVTVQDPPNVGVAVSATLPLWTVPLELPKLPLPLLFGTTAYVPEILVPDCVSENSR